MDIKILMCCHKSYEIVPPFCIPIQGGASLHPPIEGAVRDNTGDNISEKNREYCELTALYFAWKNISADYYGLCHYRRFFGFAVKSQKPYITIGKLADKKQIQYLGTENDIRNLLDEFDVILPRSEDMGITVREHYAASKHHFEEDLQLFLEILYQHNPELKTAAEKYLSQSRQYFCNMFIMKKEYFELYCNTLFPLLEKFDKHKKTHGYFQGDRTDGYLAERFTGIYITYLKQLNVKIHEVCRIDVDCPIKKRLAYFFMPPQSKRRFIIKKIIKKIKR